MTTSDSPAAIADIADIVPHVPPKATIYTIGVSAIHRIECTQFHYAKRVSYAQFKDGRVIEAAWVEKGGGRYSMHRDFPDSRWLIVLAGHGHPEPRATRPSDWRTNPEWIREFENILDRHVAETGATVLVNWRDATTIREQEGAE